jgi:hypothetical protein
MRNLEKDADLQGIDYGSYLKRSTWNRPLLRVVEDGSEK